MHADLRTFGDPRWNRVLSSAWNFSLSLQDHSWAILGSNPPTSGLQLGILRDRVILPRARLEKFRLLKCQITSCLSSNLERWLLICNFTKAWRVVARAWLERLFLSHWAVVNIGSHRVRGQVLTGEGLGVIVTGAWYLELVFGFLAS